MHAGKAEKPERTERSECKENKTRAKEKREETAGSATFRASVRAEKSRVLPTQMFRLVGRRSEESQRVPGWSGWKGGGVPIWLKAGLEGGPGEGRKDGVTGRRGG